MVLEVVEATSEYFHSIDNLLRMDVGFLRTFSMWLETWDYTSEDKESMENLRSLKLIWPKQLKASSLFNRLVQTRTATPPDENWMQDFHSATFELEANIRQTKGQVEGWTQIFMRSSLQYSSLKLRDVSIQETRLEMEDVSFQNLKFLELKDRDLVEWNASTESLPCLEQLVIKYCEKLEELPSCFGEISTLKKIDVRYSSEELRSSAFRIQEEQMELGIKVDVSILEYS